MNAFQRAKNLVHARLKDFVLRKTPHTPEKTLVIIDMQSDFMRGNEEKIIPAICLLIEHAKLNEWAIIVVEYIRCGRTDKIIHQLLVNYQHWTIVCKMTSNGGPEVIQCLKNHPTWSMDLLVCGIYGPHCVAETVFGIFETSNLVKVSIVTDAITPNYVSFYTPINEQERKVKTDDVLNCNLII